MAASMTTWGTFGDPAARVWLTLLLEDGSGCALLGGADTAPAVSPITRTARAGADTSTLAGDALEVELAPLSTCLSANGELAVEHSLCRARGRVGGAEIEALGICAAASELEPGRLDSLRLAVAWFHEGPSYSLAALRPRRAKGHDRDPVVAALLEADASAPFVDPRLSTTYAADGSPVRAGLELWLEAVEGEEDPLPHRAAGEALAPPTDLPGEAFALQVAPLQWHSRGREGFGSYGVMRPR